MRTLPVCIQQFCRPVLADSPIFDAGIADGVAGVAKDVAQVENFTRARSMSGQAVDLHVPHDAIPDRSATGSGRRLIRTDRGPRIGPFLG